MLIRPRKGCARSQLTAAARVGGGSAASAVRKVEPVPRETKSLPRRSRSDRRRPGRGSAGTPGAMTSHAEDRPANLHPDGGGPTGRVAATLGLNRSAASRAGWLFKFRENFARDFRGRGLTGPRDSLSSAGGRETPATGVSVCPPSPVCPTAGPSCMPRGFFPRSDSHLHADIMDCVQSLMLAFL